MSSAPKVALVVKRSAWDRYLELPGDRFKQLLDRSDASIANVKSAHDEHSATVAEVNKALSESGAVVTRIRRTRSGFEAGGFNLVVTVGGDGTLLHASHSLATTPVLAINSSPTYSVGFFCGARQGEVAKALRGALRGTLKSAHLNRMQVTVNDEVASSRVLNDALFCHSSPAATSRYIVEYLSATEEQKSSGLWIGPAAGSTAAQRSAGGKVLPLGSRSLQMVVREPYTPDGKPYRLNHVITKQGQVIALRSKSRQMRLYLDGHDRIVKVGLGDVVCFSESPQPLHLLGISSRRKWGE